MKPPFPILVNGGFGRCGSCADKSPLRVDEQLEAKLKEKEAELDRLRAELAKEAPKKNEVAKLKEARAQLQKAVETRQDGDCGVEEGGGRAQRDDQGIEEGRGKAQCDNHWIEEGCRGT